MENQEVIDEMVDSAESAIAEIKEAIEFVYQARPDNETDITKCLERAVDHCKELRSTSDKYEEPDEVEEVELHEIEGSTIEWNRYRANINFTDREIMDTLEKLFFNGKSAQEILNHLEQL